MAGPSPTDEKQRWWGARADLGSSPAQTHRARPALATNPACPPGSRGEKVGMSLGKPTPGRCHVTAQLEAGRDCGGGGGAKWLLPCSLWDPDMEATRGSPVAKHSGRAGLWRKAFVPVKQSQMQQLGGRTGPSSLTRHGAWRVWGMGRGCTQVNNGTGGRGRPHKKPLSPAPASLPSSRCSFQV